MLLEHRHRITVEEYHQIIDSGVLGPEPRVELLEGVILKKMTKLPPHNLASDLVQYLFVRLLPPGYFVSVATSMTIEGRESEPEPDAQVLRGELRDYTGRRRTPGDALIVVEISDSSYRIDRGTKWITYAGAGVPAYWIVDLNRRQLEIHTEPTGDGASARYTCSQTFGPEDEIPLLLDGREVARFVIKEILP